MSKPIAFIIGAGKRIGASTAEVLQSKGYRVAVAARSLKPEDSTDDKLHLSVDLSNPDSIGPAFSSLRKQWGEPSVVFYNGMPMQLSPEIPWIINTY
jgi:NAD(P)-dependent dehydrogenase (short-subunit alcohol dehydrogenase family)